MIERTAEEWIKLLRLQPHPEGGWYREEFRSDEMIAPDGLPNRFDSARSAITSIYFLLRKGEHSNLHRLQATEIWYYHAGGSATLHLISAAGEYATQRIGPDASRGDELQVAIAPGNWFGMQLGKETDYILTGCAVAPGFEFADLELANRAILASQFPQHADTISQLTPAGP